MSRIVEFINKFIKEEDGSTTNEYGSVYLLVAVALFVVFAAFQGGMLATISTISSEFVNKLDSLTIANSGQRSM